MTAKHCSDLTLLCIDNQHLFLQCHAVIFIHISGGKTDQPGHLPPKICIESHSNVNLCPVFYLKAYLRYTESFRQKPDGLCVTFLFLGNNRQHRWVCAKTISSWVRKVLHVAKAHIFLGSSWGAAALAAGVSLVSIRRQESGPEFQCQLDTIFPPTSLLQIGTMVLYRVLCWASVSRCSLDKCQAMTYIESYKCWAVRP